MAFKKISISDVAGFKLGNSENSSAGTGCTVIISDKAVISGLSTNTGIIDLSGIGSENSRDLSQSINAVVISGGASFGSAAVGGVVRELAAAGIGFNCGGKSVPHVYGVCINDLNVGSEKAYPDSDMGADAAKNALAGYEFMFGNHGAGTGASVGKLCGMKHAMKSGLGSFACMDDELQVGAIAVVNSVGDVYDGANNMAAGVLADDGFTLDGCIKALKDRVCGGNSDSVEEHPVGSTTACLLTNAKLSPNQCNKLAEMLNDAYARAVKPAHTTLDNDTIFVMTTGEIDVNFNAYAALATDIMQYSLIDAVLSAESSYGLQSAKDIAK